MIKLSNDINKAEQEIIEAKRLTAPLPNPTNWNVPTDHGLTGRQLYVQFCMRMAKFDMEFATLDPVMASSWINTGMTRLGHEFEKRLLANPGDRSALILFKPYISEVDLTQEVSNLEPYEYKYNIPVVTTTSKKLLPEAMHIYAKLTKTFADTEAGKRQIPTWWPYFLNGTTHQWEANELKMAYLEIDGPDEANLPFWTSNSFSELENGPFSRLWVKRDPTGFPIHIIVNSIRNRAKGLDGFINSGAIPPSSSEADELLHITKVGMFFLDFDGFLANAFIDTSSDQFIKIPKEYHNDVVDYAIDAYFESMFFHQFGKYSMKQARQDAEGGSQTASRQGKLDAVPPQRYKVGAGA
jgi:hypothetical protein